MQLKTSDLKIVDFFAILAGIESKQLSRSNPNVRSDHGASVGLFHAVQFWRECLALLHVAERCYLPNAMASFIAEAAESVSVPASNRTAADLHERILADEVLARDIQGSRQRCLQLINCDESHQSLALAINDHIETVFFGL